MHNVVCIFSCYHYCVVIWKEKTNAFYVLIVMNMCKSLVLFLIKLAVIMRCAHNVNGVVWKVDATRKE